ncbi:hypothetical protein L873DRAFT_1812529 [Choiromyces venosus 120613-1]|uniref:Uncharacterized protein n=1 Tax=Choiromyces venosus 120613-1 TaxID=1336337 RepID=A0A3N4JBW9_9PEZI|nr:hypothetical protein L873DRAFT_1812529 [Choiromyces venosus 120613-1]
MSPIQPTPVSHFLLINYQIHPTLACNSLEFVNMTATAYSQDLEAVGKSLLTCSSNCIHKHWRITSTDIFYYQLDYYLYPFPFTHTSLKGPTG